MFSKLLEVFLRKINDSGVKVKLIDYEQVEFVLYELSKGNPGTLQLILYEIIRKIVLQKKLTKNDDVEICSLFVLSIVKHIKSFDLEKLWDEQKLPDIYRDNAVDTSEYWLKVFEYNVL